jgi:hypothetical protein
MAETRHSVRLKTKIAAIECGDTLGPLAVRFPKFKQKGHEAVVSGDGTDAKKAQYITLCYVQERYRSPFIWQQGCGRQLNTGDIVAMFQGSAT